MSPTSSHNIALCCNALSLALAGFASVAPPHVAPYLVVGAGVSVGIGNLFLKSPGSSADPAPLPAVIPPSLATPAVSAAAPPSPVRPALPAVSGGAL